MTASLRHLPLLERHKDAFEKCVYCPKLSRAACPVSNVEPNETLIPWGKMSTTYFMARGDLSITEEAAAVAWACTGCFGCRESCDHKNPVAETLIDARGELLTRGVAPRAAQDLVSRWPRITEERQGAVRAMDDTPSGATKLLIGCSYVRRAPREALLAKRVAEALVGGPVSLASGCCGYPLLNAGDQSGFRREQASLAREVAGADRLIVLDPGCFATLRADDATASPTSTHPSTTLLIDLAASSLERLRPAPGLVAPRYHDPCQLGRGLGRYDGPRAVLERVAGAPPREFERARERADCAGSGALLPLTRPGNSDAIAAARIGEHERLGAASEPSAPIATACGSSLRRFKRSGVQVRDIVEYIAIGLGLELGVEVESPRGRDGAG